MGKFRWFYFTYYYYYETVFNPGKSALRRKIKTNMQSARNTALLQSLTRTTTMLQYLFFFFCICLLTVFFNTKSARNGWRPDNDRDNEASPFPHFNFFNYEQVHSSCMTFLLALIRYSVRLRLRQKYNEWSGLIDVHKVLIFYSVGIRTLSCNLNTHWKPASFEIVQEANIFIRRYIAV